MSSASEDAAPITAPLQPGDEELLVAFERATLTTFAHEDHLRVAFLLLRRLPLVDAIAAMVRGIQALARALDKPGLYHETVTIAYMLRVHERLDHAAAAHGFAYFRERNADLFARHPAPLLPWYREQTLHSERAKRVFVLPDALRSIPCNPDLDDTPPR